MTMTIKDAWTKHYRRVDMPHRRYAIPRGFDGEDGTDNFCEKTR